MTDYFDLLEEELRGAADRQAVGPRRAPSRLSRLAPAAAVLLAIIVGGGALLLVHRGGGGSSARPAGRIARPAATVARGRILDASGGVLVGGRTGAEYPMGSLAAQVLGTVASGHGRSGLEYEYDRALRRGEDLKTSLDARLQRVAQRALAASVKENGTSVGQNRGGAFVAIDPQNGQIDAMGSDPTFDPSELTDPMSRARFDRRSGSSSGFPLMDRAIQSAGPTGSTFKVITATAALQSGSWRLGQTYDDTGQFCFPSTTDCLHNSGHAAYGVVTLPQAIQVSDDNFFYNLAYQMNSDRPAGGALQAWARRFGIGERTGVDLPDETAGNLPTPGAAAEHEPWTVGDNVNTAVGQGDDQVTPLQLAVVYSAIENGGTIVTPHVGEDIESPSGQVLEPIDPGPRRQLDIRPAYLDAIREGLRDAATAPSGTSYDVMGHFPLAVYGKTGTAQYISANGVEQDTAWYACYVPASETTKPIVVVVTVALGGFGDVAAAPVAHEILSQWYLGHPGSFTDGVEVGDGL